MSVRRAFPVLAVLAIGALAAPLAWSKGVPPEKRALTGDAATATGKRISGGPGGPTITVGFRAGTTRIREQEGAGSHTTAAHTTARLPGRYAIPAVTLGGEPGGLSTDGNVLTLVKQPGSRQSTDLVFLHTNPLRRARTMHLDGRFSFDAISPDGSRVFLIQYLSPTDDTEYAVRAVDVASTRLLPGKIVDPAERDSSEMGGYPIDRATSPGGRWDYTLYSAPNRKPFVHALDTVAGRAHCIDLPNEYRGALAEGVINIGPGGGLTVGDERGHPVAIVDTGTFEARAPGTPAPHPVASQEQGDASGGGTDWTAICLIALGAAGSAAALTTLVRRRRAATAPG
jgi:hypothetical protein